MSQVVKLGSFVFIYFTLNVCVSVITLVFAFFTFFQIHLSQGRLVGIFVPFVY